MAQNEDERDFVTKVNSKITLVDDLIEENFVYKIDSNIHHYDDLQLEKFTQEIDSKILFKDNLIKEDFIEEIDENVPFIENVDEKILFYDNLVEEEVEILKKSLPKYSDFIKFPVDFKNLNFNEVFIVTKEYEENRYENLSFDTAHDELGSSSITLKEIENDQILILIIFRFTFNETQKILEIVTIIDKSLRLIQENIVQRSISADSLEEKIIQINNRNGNKLEITKTNTRDGIMIEELTNEVSKESLKTFVSLGTNVILMRKLSIEKFVGYFRSWSIDIDGRIVILDEYFRNPEFVTIYGKHQKVHRVDRISYLEDRQPQKSTSLFNPNNGHLLIDFSSLSSYAIRTCPIDLKLKDQWDDDVYLLLLDYVRIKRKDEWKSNRNVKKLLEDFIICVIQSRPKNLMEFTLNFLKKIERDAIVLKINQKITANRRHQQNSNE